MAAMFYRAAFDAFRLMTFCYLAALNCWLLLCPAILSHDWQMGSVPLVTSFTDTRNLATCIFFGGCLVLTYKAFTDFEVSARGRIVSQSGEQHSGIDDCASIDILFSMEESSSV